MSRVIKNNDGVAVVEGTPAASLVKDVDKFFSAKPPERMAGESISQPKKIRNVISFKDGSKGTSEMFDKPVPREEYKGFIGQKSEQKQSEEPTASDVMKDARALLDKVNKEPASIENTSTDSDAQTAKNLAREFKRKRFVERSAREQDATRGAFITTLQT